MAMSQVSNACTECSDLQIGRYVSGTVEWSEASTRSMRLADLVTQNNCPLTFVLAKPREVLKCSYCQPLFEETFHIPKLFWSLWCQGSKGDYGQYGQEEIFDVHRRQAGITSWFRLDNKQIKYSSVSGIWYQWLRCKVFSYWHASNGSTIFLIFDNKMRFDKALLNEHIFPLLKSQYLAHPAEHASNPYYVHAAFMQASIRFQNASASSVRDLIRKIEQDRYLGSDEDIMSSLTLQDGGRHCIQIRELAECSLDQVVAIKTAHRAWFEMLSKDASLRLVVGDETLDTRSIDFRCTDSRLEFCRSAMQSMLYRANANVSRINNELQLAGNIASLRVARTTSYDSRSMRNLSMLGAIFLPATFVSALFSMSFFNIDNTGNWYLHEKFWIYWAVAVPFSLMTMLVVSIRQRFIFRDHLGEKPHDRQEDEFSGPQHSNSRVKLRNRGYSIRMEEVGTRPPVSSAV